MTTRPQPEFTVSRGGRAVELRAHGETVFTFLSRDALEAFLDRGRSALNQMSDVGKSSAESG